MAVYSIEVLSGSTNGLGIKVTGTSSAASVDIHTAVTGTTDIDLVTLYAVNQDADGEARTLHLGFGGETDPDNIISVPVPNKVGPVAVLDRLPLRNTLVITAWVDEANDVMVYGRVERVDK